MNQDSRVQAFVAAFERLRAEVEKVIVGHREVITHVLTGMNVVFLMDLSDSVSLASRERAYRFVADAAKSMK